MSPHSHSLALACAAGAESPTILQADIKICAAKRVSALAMRFCSFLLRGSLNHGGSLSQMKVASIENSHFWRDAAPQPFHDDIGANASGARPISRDHTHPHESDPAVVVPVPTLLAPWNPTAILRRVVAVVVSAVKGISRRARPHVFAEVVKTSASHRGLAPSLTNRDASPAIAMKVRASGDIASPEHVLVDVVQLVRFSHAV